MRFLYGFCCLTAIVLFAGCRGPSSDAGFSDVQQITSTRISQSIRWNHTPADDRAVAEITQRLLVGEVTSDQAVQIALLNNHSLQATYAQLGIAQADVVQAGLLSNPVLFVSMRYPDHAPNGPNVELSLTEDFIDVLLMPAHVKIAAARFEQTKLQVSQAVFELAGDVKSAYYTLAGDEQMVQMRRTAADAMQLSADAAQKMSDAGNLNELDLATQQASAVQAQADLDSADAHVQSDREKLIELLGIDGAPKIQVMPRLPEPVSDPSTDDLVKLARSKRLDLLAARQAVNVAAKEARLANVASFVTELDLGADTERDPGGNRVTGPVFTLPIPLLDQGQGARLLGNATLLQASQQYQALEIHVCSQVRQAAQQMIAARHRAELYLSKIIPLQHRIIEQAQLHYNGMLLGVFQLLQAKQNEIDAGREYIAALRDYWVARSDLERAVGGELAAHPTTMPASQPSTQPAKMRMDMSMPMDMPMGAQMHHH